MNEIYLLLLHVDGLGLDFPLVGRFRCPESLAILEPRYIVCLLMLAMRKTCNYDHLRRLCQSGVLRMDMTNLIGNTTIARVTWETGLSQMLPRISQSVPRGDPYTFGEASSIVLEKIHANWNWTMRYCAYRGFVSVCFKPKIKR